MVWEEHLRKVCRGVQEKRSKVNVVDKIKVMVLITEWRRNWSVRLE